MEQRIHIAEVRDMKKSALAALMAEKGIQLSPTTEAALAAEEVAEPEESTEAEEMVESRTKTALLEFREKHNLSQAKVAALLDVFYSTVRRWETGAGQPREPQKSKLEALLALTPEELAERMANLPPTTRTRSKTSGKAKK